MRSCVVALLLALSATSEVKAQSLWVTSGELVDAFAGWKQFCRDNPPAECASPMVLNPKPFAYTRKDWANLERINTYVNTRIKPLTDREHWGVDEKWSYPYDGYGDCEDYVLMKRKLLIQLGWPVESLLITIVWVGVGGEGHAILTARTSDGDFILDNENPQILFWSDVPYRYHKQQSPVHPNLWVKLEDPRFKVKVRLGNQNLPRARTRPGHFFAVDNELAEIHREVQCTDGTKRSQGTRQKRRGEGSLSGIKRPQ